MNKEKLLPDVFDLLTVGQHVLFCGDGPYKTLTYILGNIASISHENDERVVGILRTDGARGRGNSGEWFIKSDARHNNVTIMILDSGESVSGDALSFGDVVQFNNGPYEHLGTFINRSVLGLIIAPFTDSLGTTPWIAPIDSNLLLFGKISEVMCSTHGCSHPATRSIGNRLYCNNCVEELGDITQCALCGSEVAVANSHVIQREHYCGECYYDLDNAMVNSIHGHSYKPLPRFKEISSEKATMKTNLYTGVEVEFEVPESICTLRDENWNTQDLGRLGQRGLFAKKIQALFAPKRNPWFYLKSDGSLHNGIELVTHPATLKSHRHELAWQQLFDYLKEHGCLADTTTTCGLHIHANKSIMTEEEQMKLGYFINSHRGKVEIVARRSQINYSKYRDVSQEVLENMNKCVDQDRYKALNWMNEYTVEYRMFKGTIDFKKLMASLDFVASSIAYVKSVTIEQLKAPRLSWSKYLQFIVAGEYEFLRDYLQEKGEI